MMKVFFINRVTLNVYNCFVDYKKALFLAILSIFKSIKLMQDFKLYYCKLTQRGGNYTVIFFVGWRPCDRQNHAVFVVAVHISARWPHSDCLAAKPGHPKYLITVMTTLYGKFSLICSNFGGTLLVFFLGRVCPDANGFRKRDIAPFPIRVVSGVGTPAHSIVNRNCPGQAGMYGHLVFLSNR